MISPTRKRTLAREWKRLYAEKDRAIDPRVALDYEDDIARIETQFGPDDHPRNWLVKAEPEQEPASDNRFQLVWDEATGHILCNGAPWCKTTFAKFEQAGHYVKVSLAAAPPNTTYDLIEQPKPIHATSP